MEGLKGTAQGHFRERSWKGDLSQTFLATEYLPTKYHKLRLEHFANEYTNLTNYFKFNFALPFLYQSLCFYHFACSTHHHTIQKLV